MSKKPFTFVRCLQAVTVLALAGVATPALASFPVQPAAPVAKADVVQAVLTKTAALIRPQGLSTTVALTCVRTGPRMVC